MKIRKRKQKPERIIGRTGVDFALCDTFELAEKEAKALGINPPPEGRKEARRLTVKDSERVSLVRSCNCRADSSGPAVVHIGKGKSRFVFWALMVCHGCGKPWKAYSYWEKKRGN